MRNETQMIHVMLPVQYLRQADGRRMEPHKRLMLAVLQAVVDDCRRPLSRPPGAAGASAERRLSEEARAYVASTDRSWPFSFENLCDAIGLDAACLRRELAAPPAHHPSENERPAAGGVSRA